LSKTQGEKHDAGRATLIEGRGTGKQGEKRTVERNPDESSAGAMLKRKNKKGPDQKNVKLDKEATIPPAEMFCCRPGEVWNKTLPHEEGPRTGKAEGGGGRITWGGLGYFE